MWAAAIDRNGGPEVFDFIELPDPVCPEDGLVIDVEAIAIEGSDLLARTLVAPPASHHVIGAVAAGVVVEIGPRVSARHLGERVVTLCESGSHATRRAVPATRAWAIPAGLASPEAACVPVAFGTAFECLFTAGDLQSGQTVLVHAGAGGVGMAAIQLARLAGATVIATASTADRLERLKAFGFDHGIAYGVQDVLVEAKKIAGPGGLDLVIDSVGGRTLAEIVDVLGWRGRIVSVGLAAGGGSTVDAASLWARCNSLHGVRLESALQAEHARAFAMIDACLARAAAGELRLPIAKVFALADAAAAHGYIESRHAFGRVVMISG